MDMYKSEKREGDASEGGKVGGQSNTHERPSFNCVPYQIDHPKNHNTVRIIH